MARSVSLSDEAFVALREEKREGESDSDVVLRLRREARAKRKDPERFFRGRAKYALSAAERLADREARDRAEEERAREHDSLRRRS